MCFSRKNWFRRLGHGLVLVFLFSARASFSQITDCAESAVLSNGAVLDGCKSCPGGKNIGFLGGENNGTADFTVNMNHPGLYPATVFYNVGDDRAFAIIVNTNTHLDLIFPRTPQGGNNESPKTIFLPLRTGRNTIAFNNPRESAPDLSAIVIADSPVKSSEISGSLKNSDGTPAAGVTVSLAGFNSEMKTTTDAQGRYIFPFLPDGSYYVRVNSSSPFAPYEHFCPATNTNFTGQDFKAVNFSARSQKLSAMQFGKWRVAYDLAGGTADIFCDGKLLLPKAFAVVHVPESVTSMDFSRHKIMRESIRDGFGRGVKFTVLSSNGAGDQMLQNFWLYDHTDYFLANVQFLRKPSVASNFMSPLTTQTPCAFLPGGDDRALFVPFDNDKWIRYDAVPFGGEVTSYEVSALYDNTSRNGLIMGSIEHDIWKTGVKSETSSNAVTRLEIFGGIASSATRDVLPHGKISGAVIRSPRIFIGYFSDWRDGLEAYGKANATVAPPRAWNGGVPFGWNSWGKLQFHLTFRKAIQVSDFFAKELPQFKNNGVIYLGLDAGWNKLTDTQLKQFVARCRANHQEAGIYFTPFAVWHMDDNALVPGTKYRFKDICLYARGKKESIAGGMAIDPTHPGTKKLIENTIAEFKKDGFKYIKADFLTYGSLEADRYFDARVTTGIQAYNQGMKFVDEEAGEDVFLNEAISPLFPAQYANSRRIACDAFGGIGQTEYTLNSLTYGWWLSQVYDFNDPDEMVLDGYAENENRARVTSAAITGLFISGDDFSAAPGAVGKARAEKFLANDSINDVARVRKSFRPVEGDTGNRAANLFFFEDKNNCYLAAFNYSDQSADFHVNFSRVGLRTRGRVEARELWRGAIIPAAGSMTIRLAPADTALYEFCGKPELK